MRKTFAVLLAVGVAVLAAAPAAQAHDALQAHNYLIASSPSQGETLTELPESFSVTTNEDLLAIGGSTAGFAFQIVDAAGTHYETGCVTVEGPTMSTVPRLGEAGDYTALWQVVSADGHTVSGEIDFTWTGTPTPDDGAAECVTFTSTSEPQATPPSAFALSDVLWIGGAVLAVGIAIAVTIAVLSRRRR
jgi:methionine-rich copper-binding protein CopC